VKSSLWAFFHLLQIALSNQSSGNEDKLDKPWRPVPSGRVSVEQVRRLRWILSAACLAASFVLGRCVFGASLGVTLYTILYDDLLLRGHLVFRNLCIAAGYLASDIGTLTIMSESSAHHPAILDNFSNYIFHLLLQNRRVGWTG